MSLHITRCEDGSVLLEYIKPGERLGLSFEPKPEESSWYWVFKGKDGVDGDSGCLTKEQIDTLKGWIESI